jgi:hypothetical protein
MAIVPIGPDLSGASNLEEAQPTAFALALAQRRSTAL